ncbi:hypothetical protein M422DRAFT_244175 [Sphaerobolus stellatus SS14]|nr:hypothetical protein M422DRAFT_244175 [Sphaerobolus stellatus SS14]
MASSQAPAAPAKKQKAIWNAVQDDTLVVTMEEQKKLGLQSESGWKAAVWTAVAVVVNKEHPLDLKDDYKTVKELLGMSGFGWDEGKGVVRADEHVWQALIKTNSSYEKWQTKPFPLYYQMAGLVSDVIATGDNVYCLEASSASYSSGRSSTAPEESVEANVNHDSDEEVTTATISKKQYKPESPEPSRKHTKGRTSAAHSIEHMVDVVGDLTTALMMPSSDATTVLVPSSTHCSQAYQLAEEEEELSDNELVRVMKLFSRDTPAADAYLAFKRKMACSLWLQDALSNP